MSPHRIAGPLDRSSINSGNKTVDWPEVSDPLTLPNLVAIQQEVYEISAVENLCSQKSGPKFIKIGEDLLRTNALHRVTFHRARPSDVQEKRYKIFTPSVFWRPRGSLGQSSPVLALMYSGTARPPLSTCQISSPSENPFTIYLLPNFDDFVDGAIDKSSK